MNIILPKYSLLTLALTLTLTAVSVSVSVSALAFGSTSISSSRPSSFPFLSCNNNRPVSAIATTTATLLFNRNGMHSMHNGLHTNLGTASSSSSTLFRRRQQHHKTSASTILSSSSSSSSASATAVTPRRERRDVKTKIPGVFWSNAKSKYMLDFDWMMKGSFRQRIIGAFKFFFLGGLVSFFKIMYGLYFRSVPATIYDARAKEEEEGLSKSDFFDKYGFVLVNHTSAMDANGWEESDRNNLGELIKSINAKDDGQQYKQIMDDFRNGDTPVKSIYAKEVVDLITSIVIPRATNVMPPARGIRRYITTNINKAPAKQLHNDYGLDFDDVVDRNPAFDFKSQKLQYEETKSNEYMLINLWRPIKPMSTPCRSYPLCFLDSTTLGPDDFVEIDNMSLGVITVLKENPSKHKFYYYPDMTVDEVLIFKQFHKVRNETTARMPTFHTAFVDPAADKTTEGRVSFEYRVGLLC